MKIKKIEIKNFRSIKDTQIIQNFGNSLILVGKNNSGKSSIINAIKLFFEGKDFGISEKDFYKGETELSIKIGFENITDEYLLSFLKYNFNRTESKKIKAIEGFGDYVNEIIENEDGLNEQQKNIIKDYFIQSQKEKYFVVDNSVIIDLNIKSADLKLTYNVGSNSLKDTEFFPDFLFIDDERNFSNEISGKSGSISEKLFKNIEINKESRKTYETIISSISSGTDIGHLSISDLEVILERKIQLDSKDIGTTISKYFQQYYKKGNYEIRFNPTTSISHRSFSLNTKLYNPFLDEEIDLDKVGAGLRSIYILSLLKAYNEINEGNNTIICIEEPELYLHPELQKQMSDVLKELSNEHSIVFSSHSPLMFKDFNINSIKKVSMNDNKTNIEDGDYEKIIDELGYSTLDILNGKFILLVEGIEDIRRFKTLLKRFYNISDDELKEIIIISTDSCTNIGYYATLKFLDKVSFKDKISIIRDSDSKDKTLIKNALVREINAKVSISDIENKILVLNYYSFENYFLNFEVLSEIGVGLSETVFFDEYITKFSRKIFAKYKEHNGIDYPNTIDYLKTNIDEAKKIIKGHDIYNYLQQYLPLHCRKSIFDEKYIELSSYNDFKEIIDFLDNQVFFQSFPKINR